MLRRTSADRRAAARRSLRQPRAPARDRPCRPASTRVQSQPPHQDRSTAAPPAATARTRPPPRAAAAHQPPAPTGLLRSLDHRPLAWHDCATSRAWPFAAGAGAGALSASAPTSPPRHWPRNAGRGTGPGTLGAAPAPERWARHPTGDAGIAVLYRDVSGQLVRPASQPTDERPISAGSDPSPPVRRFNGSPSVPEATH